MRNDGWSCRRAAKRFPLCATRASSELVTTELASDDLIAAGSGLACGVD
jgi:hypothetical protein